MAGHRWSGQQFMVSPATPGSRKDCSPGVPPQDPCLHVALFPSICVSPLMHGRTNRSSTNQGVFLASGGQQGLSLWGSLSSEV